MQEKKSSFIFYLVCLCDIKMWFIQEEKMCGEKKEKKEKEKNVIV